MLAFFLRNSGVFPLLSNKGEEKRQTIGNFVYEVNGGIEDVFRNEE